MPTQVPFTDCFTASPSTLFTPAGPIPYWVQAPYQGYAEQWTKGAAGNTRVRLWVRWDDSFDFPRFALGFTERTLLSGTPVLTRHVPLKCPWTEFQFCNNLNLVKQAGQYAPDPVEFDNWFRMDGAVCYEADFVTVNYPVLSDSEVPYLLGPTQPDELKRYTTTVRRVMPREERRPDFGFKDASSGTVISQVGFSPDYTIEYSYLVREWPAEAFPETHVKNCLLHANSAIFDGKPIGTMLYLGYTEPLVPYRGPNNGLFYDVNHLFSYKPQGWNKYRQRNLVSGDYAYVNLVTNDAAATPPYALADVHTVFEPE